MLQNKRGLRAVACWPRRNGKDLTSINILAAKALERKGLYLYIAPFANQVRSIIWEGSDGTGQRFRDYIPKEVVVRTLDQSMKLWLSNGSLIQLVGSDNPDAIVGTNPMGIVFTEFSLHKPGIWQFMRPVLAENGGWALFNGTPRGLNHFYDMYKMAESNEKWFHERLTCEDTGYPTAEQIQDERDAGMPESLIQQEFYVSWTASSEETLIPLDNIQRAINQPTLASEDYNFAMRIMGVDPAFAERGDRAVIMRRQGRNWSEPEVFQGIDPMALATRCAEVIRTHHIDLCFVDAGRGEAVWSRLFQLGFQDRVIPVDFGGKTYDTLCYRKKDEIWNRMKRHICDPERPAKVPDNEELIRDLSAPTFEINDRGLMQLEGKKSLLKRGFRSTDLADAAALMYTEPQEEAPILPERLRDAGMTPEMVRRLTLVSSGQEEYDPLTYMENYEKQVGGFV